MQCNKSKLNSKCVVQSGMMKLKLCRGYDLGIEYLVFEHFPYKDSEVSIQKYTALLNVNCS